MSDSVPSPGATVVGSLSHAPDTIRQSSHAIAPGGIVDNVIPQARPLLPRARPLLVTQNVLAPLRPRADRLAVASAICGFTAIVPIVAQVAGLTLGIAGLIRIRRARRQGVLLAGTGWAWTGILTSGLALLGWVAMFGALLHVGASLTGTTESLQAVFDNLP